MENIRARQREENPTNIENYDENIGEEFDEDGERSGLEDLSNHFINHHQMMEENF